MSRFLLAVWSLESHVNPNLAVAKALRDRDHDVAFYAGPKAATEIGQNGFRVFPFQAVREELASAQFTALLESQASARKLSQTFTAVLLSQLVPQIEDLAAIIDAWHPDVLITDMAMVAPFAVLHEWKKVPVAVLSHVGYCMVPGPQGPVPGRAMPPRKTLLSRAQASIIHRVADWITRDVPRQVDSVRQVYGLKPTGLRVTQLHASVDLLLIPSIPELDYSRTDLPSSVCYVGPCLWPALVSAGTSDESIRPIVVVEEGGYYRSDPFLLRVAIDALGGREWDVRVIAGRDRNVSALGNPPANINFEEHVDHADLIITTGNTESVLRALSRGIPLIVVPSLLDQSEMALRVELFGAGISIRENGCNKETLIGAVRKIFSDASYKKKATQAAALLSNDAGASRAVLALEKLTPTNQQ